MFSGLKASKKPPQRASQSPRSFRARQTANARVATRNHAAAPVSFCASHRGASNIQRRSVDVFRPENRRKTPRHNALPIAALFQGAPDGQCARRSAKFHAAPVSFCARPTATFRIFSAARSMFSGLKTGEKPPRHNALPIAALFHDAPDGQCARRSTKLHAAPVSFCARIPPRRFEYSAPLGRCFPA